MRTDQLRTDIEALIRIDSQNPPGREAGVAAYLADRIAAIGGQARLVEVAPGRPNVIGTFDFGPGPTLLLTSHLDTVPVGSGSRDLLTPTVEDGRVYGRGACDAKGSLVAMLAACEIATEHGGLHGRVVFAGVIDEEAGGAGTKNLAAEEPRPDWAIVGEPTDLQPTIGHKGSLRKRVVFTGRAAHSSDPDAGVNAIYRAARFVLEVERWNERLRAWTHPLYGRAVASANVIQGGTKMNVIPDRCWVDVDRRLLPGETDGSALTELEAMLEPDVAIEDLGMGKPPAAIDPGHPLARALQESAEAVTGRRLAFAGFRAGADMGFLLAAGVPTAMLGPGSIDQAHTADEYVELADVALAAAIYADVARRLLA
jgi:acetylornithine deacetylase/succinyl-diaminopimelate desuccinylase family protein